MKLTFVPHLVPMIRGIHATIYVECEKEFEVQSVYDQFYLKEPFVDIMQLIWPQIQNQLGPQIFVEFLFIKKK